MDLNHRPPICEHINITLTRPRFYLGFNTLCPLCQPQNPRQRRQMQIGFDTIMSPAAGLAGEAE